MYCSWGYGKEKVSAKLLALPQLPGRGGGGGGGCQSGTEGGRTRVAYFAEEGGLFIYVYWL